MANKKHFRILPLVAVLVAGLTACSSESADSSDTKAADTSWSFTDDLGRTVTLDAKPTRVAGFHDQVVPLLNYGLKPVAAWGYSSIADDARYEGLDTSGIEEIGSVYGELDLEKLAAARPDVIVSEVFPSDAAGTIDKTQPNYGFKDLDQQKQVEAIAPVITIIQGGDGGDVVDRTTGLATALGADAATVAKGKERYDTASANLTKAAEANPLTVTTLYADADGISVAKAQDDPGLRLYASLGVKFFEPKPEGYYWGNYSWENGGQVGGDLWLLQQAGYDEAQMRKQPTTAKAAALTAGQVRAWLSPALDYVSQAAYMEQLTAWLTEAKPLT
ncbi:hypothetical protein GCM10022221_27550 [Actinocorallia aurea]